MLQTPQLKNEQNNPCLALLGPFNWDKVFTVSHNTVNKKLRQRVWKRLQLAIECHPLGEYSKSQRFFHFQLNKLIIKR